MLSVITKNQILRRYLAYDLEWIPGTMQIRLVGCFDGIAYRCYATVSDFLDGELTHKNRAKWFYAHAGGLADFQFILDEIIRQNEMYPGRWKVDGHFSGSSMIIAHVKRGSNSWHFVDSYWLLRSPLRLIGKWIGLDKGQTGDITDSPEEEGLSDDEYARRCQARRDWYATVSIMTLREYNERDCVILWKAIAAFEVAILEMGGQLGFTLASSAMTLFRRKYLSSDIPTSLEVNEKARLAYFASRVEVFEQDIEDSYYYDVNSSFPYAMTFVCPGEMIGSVSSLPEEGNYPYIADVEVLIPDGWISPTPLRMEGRIFFPVGRWRSWLSNIDIELLRREGGKILRCHECLLFAPFDDLREYATDLYNRRKNASSAFEKAAYKLLLNSLYGKFAESSAKSGLVINPATVPITAKEQDEMGMVQLYPGAWVREKQVPVPHCHVPISVHITAIARRTLYDYISLCRDCHYCDTDGFSTTELIGTGNNLGAIKLEKRVKRGKFVLPKLYTLEGEVDKGSGKWETMNYVKGKGFSRLTASRFAKLVEGESIEYERMARIRENLGYGRSRPSESVIRKRVRIGNIWSPDFDVTQSVLPKRFTYPDGTTRPWSITELKQILGKEK